LRTRRQFKQPGGYVNACAGRVAGGNPRNQSQPRGQSFTSCFAFAGGEETEVEELD